MRIVVAGGSGLLGRALVASSLAAGDSVVVLSRAAGGRADGAAPPTAGAGQVRVVGWTPGGKAGPWAAELRTSDVVVNLAGHSIGGRRWTGAERGRILESRVLATRTLVDAMAAAGGRPPVLVSGSAVGFYGTSDDRPLSEQSPAGHGFLADVCRRWEEEARRAERCGARVVLLRTGVVLAAGGAALPKMARPFRLFAGGPVGSGSQYVSWIHIHDWVGMARWVMARCDLSGPFNLTAPAPATNLAFSQAIGHALGRPAWLPVPAAALRLAFGEMADEVLLGGQRVVPERALAFDYQFAFPDLDLALRDVLGGR